MLVLYIGEKKEGSRLRPGHTALQIEYGLHNRAAGVGLPPYVSLGIMSGWSAIVRQPPYREIAVVIARYRAARHIEPEVHQLGRIVAQGLIQTGIARRSCMVYL